MVRKRFVSAIVAVLSLSACTPLDVRSWVSWWNYDEPRATEWLHNQDDLLLEHRSTGGEDVNVPYTDWILGDCDSFRPYLRYYGLPESVFVRVMRIESGCNPWSWVVDSNDIGGGLFGLNFKGNLAEYLWDLCGATVNNIRGYVPLQMECAKALYESRGLDPWQGGSLP